MDVEDLTCRELVELVGDYLDETLPADQRVRLDAHFSVCEGCSNYREQLRTTVRLIRRLRQMSPLVPIPEPLLDAFRSLRRGSAGTEAD